MNSFLDFGTACRREAREQHDRRGLEAGRRVREDVGGRACSVKMARDGSSGDLWHWWREAVYREGSDHKSKAPEHASFCKRLISSVCSLWLVRAAQLPDLRECDVTCSWVIVGSSSAITGLFNACSEEVRKNAS